MASVSGSASRSGSMGGVKDSSRSGGGGVSIGGRTRTGTVGRSRGLGGVGEDRATTTAGYGGVFNGGSIVGTTGLGGQPAGGIMGNAAANMRRAMDDAESGGMLAGMFGGYETMDPNTAVRLGQAEWGFDPTGMAVGLLGAGLGVPGIGTLAGFGANMAGNPLGMGLGAAHPWGGRMTGGIRHGGGSGSPGPMGGNRGIDFNQMRAAAMPAAQPGVGASPASTGAPPGTPSMPGAPGLLNQFRPQGGMLPGYGANTRFGQGNLKPFAFG